MSVTFDIISIGCLSKNRFWQENAPVRAPHATTTLVRDAGKNILVDPSLPGDILQRLLSERSGLRPDQIDMVFLTCFRPVHRRGLDLFDEAERLMGEKEIESVREHLSSLAERERDDSDARELIASERSVLERIKPAPDRLTPQVHLFPTPGATAGSCGLLLTPPARTVAIAGDAVLTRPHFEAGMVFEQSFDPETAKESLSELIEIADCFIPGHDNLILPAPRV